VLKIPFVVNREIIIQLRWVWDGNILYYRDGVNIVFGIRTGFKEEIFVAYQRETLRRIDPQIKNLNYGARSMRLTDIR
jgi:hypothetical protein